MARNGPQRHRKQTYCIRDVADEGGGGFENEWCGHPGRQSPEGGKINVLNEKFSFSGLQIFKYSVKPKKIRNMRAIS